MMWRDAVRHSLLWRVDAADAGQSLSAADLRAQVGAELAELDAELDIVWSACVDGPQSRLPLRLDPSLGFDASVGFNGEVVDIEMSFGAVLALDDLILTTTCQSLFFAPNRAAFVFADKGERYELWDPLTVVGADRERPDRYVDYSAGLRNDALASEDLVQVAPLDAWRLLQVNLLSELVLAWVLLHERCHWALGHLGLRRARARSLRLTETQPASPDATPDDLAEDRLMELQADAEALMILSRYVGARNGPCDRYEELVATLGLPDDPRLIKTIDIHQKRRLCLTAASLACLAFERARDQQASPSRTHPTPSARLMRLFMCAPLLSDLAQRNEEGHWVYFHSDNPEDDTEASGFLEETLGMSLFDLEIVGRTLDLDIRALSPTEDGGFSGGPSEWLTDLQSFWTVEDEPDATRTSPAGRELDALRVLDAALIERLEAVQTALFGQPTTVHL